VLPVRYRASGVAPGRFENCAVNGDGIIDFADISPFVTGGAGGLFCFRGSG
jgi:hypothetical protein